MDVAMPEMNGIEATRRIVEADPEIKVIGLSMHSDGQYVLEMLRAGATGYLLKDCAQEDLAQAIRIVQANLTFLSPGLADSVARDFVGPRGSAAAETAEAAEQAPELTPRERQVLVLMAEGLTTKQIASELEVSVKTVESHRQHIMEKLGDNSIAGLTRYAIQRGLIDLN
jgi:DNA-binding NarL/FixJ family response regulator